MTDWRDINVLRGGGHDGARRSANVSTIAFDTEQQLLFVGHEDGLLVTYYGTALQRYTSIRAHSSPILEIVPTAKIVVSLARGSLHAVTRRGVGLWAIQGDELAGARCMTIHPRSAHEILVAGCNHGMSIVNIETGAVTQAIDSDAADAVCVRRSGKNVVIGSSQGEVRVYDTSQSSHPCIAHMQAHNATVKEVLPCGGVILSAGYFHRYSTYGLETVIKSFDVKTFRPLPPLNTFSGTAFMRTHPRMTTTALLLSPGGQLQTIDTGNLANLKVCQLSVMSYVTAFDVAPSGTVIAYCDSDNSIHLASTQPQPSFTDLAIATEFADPVQQVPSFDIDDPRPLHTVGMPYYYSELLSSWPSATKFTVGRLPTKIDRDLLNNVKVIDGVGHVANNKRRPRNLAEAERTATILDGPMFLSEKAKALAKSGETATTTDNVFEDMGRISIGASEIPSYYRRMEIRYSRFGIEDFDFEFFNRTKHAGIETPFANSYCNALLQLFNASASFRKEAVSHAATNCLREDCLLCEMGYLFTMLAAAQGQNCHAGNFLGCFARNTEAQALGLVMLDDAIPPSQPLAAITHSLSRFLLETVCQEDSASAGAANANDRASSGLDKLIGIHSKLLSKCVCGLESVSPNSSVVTDLIYGRAPAYARKDTPTGHFATILRASLHREGNSRGWCPGCRQYQPVVVRRIIQSLPPVLFLNAFAHSSENWRNWTAKDWPPTQIGLSLVSGKLNCYQGRDLEKKLGERSTPSYKHGASGGGREKVDVYALRAMTVEVRLDQSDSHMVTYVKIDDHKWVLFNDFLVREVSEEEVLQVTARWKIPAVLVYEVAKPARTEDSLPVDCSLLYQDWPRPKPPLRPADFTPLRDQKLDASFLVAIDAEFVSLQREEIELKSDGTRHTLQPRRNSLARVSVLDPEGRPFIDDYIATTSPIVDYLTEYSGIHEGDLDPAKSPFSPIPLKIAYKKLYALVRLGCTFVGHGLRSDFRTINLMLPREQVIDTVELFYSKERARKLSLKFLAWFFLDEKIQQDEHDSIEDARTALKLYRKYQSFVADGTLDLHIRELYEEGRNYGFRAPEQ